MATNGSPPAKRPSARSGSVSLFRARRGAAAGEGAQGPGGGWVCGGRPRRRGGAGRAPPGGRGGGLHELRAPAARVDRRDEVPDGGQLLLSPEVDAGEHEVDAGARG